MTGCVKTIYKDRIEYVPIEVPQSMLEPCENIPTSITTNGELLMAYISLQTAYLTCAAKVSSLNMLIKTYEDTYMLNTPAE